MGPAQQPAEPQSDSRFGVQEVDPVCRNGQGGVGHGGGGGIVACEHSLCATRQLHGRESAHSHGETHQVPRQPETAAMRCPACPGVPGAAMPRSVAAHSRTRATAPAHLRRVAADKDPVTVGVRNHVCAVIVDAHKTCALPGGRYAICGQGSGMPSEACCRTGGTVLWVNSTPRSRAVTANSATRNALPRRVPGPGGPSTCCQTPCTPWLPATSAASSADLSGGQTLRSTGPGRSCRRWCT